MEDGVTVTYEDMVSSENSTSTGEEGEKQKERIAAKESKEKGLRSSDHGVISNLISVLVSRNSEEEEEKVGGVRTQGRKQEEEKEGGIINHLISNLVSPLSPKGKSEDTYTTSDQEEKGSGGIFNNLISGILDGGGEDEKNGGNEAAASGGDGGGGGLIDNLVSHLPTPLAENVEAPATDEASILIHSIVHD